MRLRPWGWTGFYMKCGCASMMAGVRLWVLSLALGRVMVLGCEDVRAYNQQETAFPGRSDFGVVV